MELKPGYQRTEAGLVPKEWTSTRVCELGIVVTGGTPSTSEPTYWNGDRPWVTPTDITGQRDIFESERMISDAGLRSIRALPANSVLVTCIASIGKNAILRSAGGCNQQINAVVPSDAHKAEFLYYVFEAAKTYLLANAGTTATSIVSKAVFQQLVFSIPPLPEQRAIAEALSDADALLDGLDRLIAKKRDLKQAAMQQLLTGKTRLPGFSGEWKPLVFGDLASPGMDRVNPKLTGGHAFCVELEHIEQKTGRLLGWSETAPQSSLKAVFAADDVLFGKLRAYLRKYWHASMPGVCSTEIWVLKAKSAVAPGYLYQLVQTDWFIDAASTAYGTHMPRSDWKVVRDLELRVPRKDEQAKIAGVLGDMDAEIDALKRRRDKAYDLKHAMMQELLTGKTRLVAPEADHA